MPTETTLALQRAQAEAASKLAALQEADAEVQKAWASVSEGDESEIDRIARAEKALQVKTRLYKRAAVAAAEAEEADRRRRADVVADEAAREADYVSAVGGALAEHAKAADLVRQTLSEYAQWVNAWQVNARAVGHQATERLRHDVARGAWIADGRPVGRQGVQQGAVKEVAKALLPLVRGTASGARTVEQLARGAVAFPKQ
jgi:hypothetical protein